VTDLLDEAVFILRECAPEKLLYGAFSGGKDSVALKRVCQIAGVKPQWYYHNTTIDPPELIRFIRKHHKDVLWNQPKYGNFFVRARQKGLMPSFKIRWCCDEYKEWRGPINTTWISGVRREESPSRSKQQMVGLHLRTRRVFIRPIINWDSEFLWDFIRSEKLPYSELYDEGFHRLGCVGCPLASKANRLKEFKRWPRYAKKWQELARYCYDLKAPWASFASFEEFYDCWMDRKF
jgi:phosphoadenosine phosphosulfate reductase